MTQFSPSPLHPLSNYLEQVFKKKTFLVFSFIIWLRWVLVAGAQASHRGGRVQALGHAGSVVAACGFSRVPGLQ